MFQTKERHSSSTESGSTVDPASTVSEEELQKKLSEVSGHLDSYDKLVEMKQGIEENEKITPQEKEEILSEINETIAEFKKEIPRFLEYVEETKALIGESLKLKEEITEITGRLNNLISEYEDLQGSISDIRSYADEERRFRESKTESSRNNNPHSLIEFTELTSTGRTCTNSQYLKLGSDGKLLVWDKSGQTIDGKPEYVWHKAKEYNQKRGVAKTLVLHQKSDGSFVDSSGKEVKYLSSKRGVHALSNLQSKIGELKTGEISGMKPGVKNEYYHNGARVVFTRYDESAQSNKKSEVQEEKQSQAERREVTRHDYSKISFSVKSADGTPVRSEKYLRIDNDGDLQVWERDSSVLGTESKFSWQKASENNQQNFRMRFQALYQESDGSFTDAEGKKVTHLDTYQGRVPISEISGSLESLEEGVVSGSKSGSENKYFYQGAHVVFTKRSASAASEKTSGTEETLKADTEESRRAEAEKSERDTSSEKQNDTSQDLDMKAWRKFSYEQTNSNGIAQTKESYARLNNNNELKIYEGKDSQGSDIWKSSKDTSFSGVYVYEGDVYNEKGEKIRYLETGDKRDNARVSAGIIASRVDFDSSGIGTLPPDMLREHRFNGKQVVFIDGKPPGLK